MNPAKDNDLKMGVYAIYLCKSRADIEAEKLRGTGKLGYTKRRERGIRIIGKKNKIERKKIGPERP